MDDDIVLCTAWPQIPRKQSIRQTDWARTPIFPGNIVLRPSTVVGAGLGLFVRTDVANGQLIALYSGPRISSAEAHLLLERGYGSHLRGLFCADLVIDGIRTP